MNEKYKNKFPFITGLEYNDKEYFGIVSNHNTQVTSFYDIEDITDLEEKKTFLKLGEIWWWESNRQIPIDIFLHIEMQNYRKFLKTLTSKDVNHIFGPMTSLHDLLKKRIKRKNIIIKKSQ